MLTTMRMARLWTLWLAVLAIGAVVPGLALAAGRVLTPQDTVSIKVVNQPDMDTTTRVETDGTISFPYVGRIRAAGLERRPAGARNRKTIGVASDRHRSPRAGRHHHLRHASERPRASGGARSVHAGSANKSHATFVSRRRSAGRRPGWNGVCPSRRRQDPEIRFDGGPGRARPGANLRIANNDEVFVDLAPFYYLYGYVGRPGEFPLLRPITVQQAISIGGGLATLGSEWRIKIKRKSGNGQTYEVPASLDDQVEAGDTIVVSERIF